MSEIIFIYKGYEICIQCLIGEKMKNILERLCNKLKVNKKEIYLLHNGKILDEDLNENQIFENEKNKRIILVYKFDETKLKDVLIKNQML